MHTLATHPILLPALALLALPFAASAQSSNVRPDAKFAWSENAGWLNARDAGSPVASQGLRVGPSFLSGFVWGENIGWINFGDGSPANAVSYANTSGLDFGVNLDSATGNLSGLAWGENIGWINFSWAPPASPDRPRLAAGRFLGFAWAENIGWINLNLPVPGQFIAITQACSLADLTGVGGPPNPPDGLLTGDDFVAFINAFSASDPLADITGIGGPPSPPDTLITGDDFIAFIAAFAAGCP